MIEPVELHSSWWLIEALLRGFLKAPIQDHILRTIPHISWLLRLILKAFSHFLYDPPPMEALTPVSREVGRRIDL